MLNSITNIEKLLLEIDGVVTYQKDTPIEVRPGIFSPIYINLKKTWANFYARQFITKKLTKLLLMNFTPDVICGIESGGTYYAARAADVFKKPLILFRRDEKNYGVMSRIVGDTPSRDSSVALIDDVFATGLTISKAIGFFKRLNCKIKVFAIFSYGFDLEVGKILGVEIRSVSNFRNLCEIGVKINRFEAEDINFLINHVKTYKNYLAPSQKSQYV